MADVSRVLWLGNLPEHLDPARDVVFSAATLASREADLVAYAEHGCLALSQFDTADMGEAEAVTQHAYREVAMPYLAKLLKQRGGAEFSPTGLSILAGPWLMFLLHTCWLNYRILERHIATLGDAPVVIVAPEAPPFAKPPAGSPELVAMIINSDFQAWVASRFLRSLKPPSWVVSGYVPKKIDSLVREGERCSGWRDKIRRQVRNILWSGRCTSEQIPLHWAWLFSAMCALRKTNLAAGGPGYSLTLPHSPDVLLPTPFISELTLILEKCTPTFFTERFVRGVEQVRRTLGFKPGFARIVSSNIYSDESNLRKAMAYEAKEVVLSVQHGGGYGTHRVFPLSPESEYLGGPFITCGWRRHGDYSVQALDLPSPALSGMEAARKRARRSRDIVFVGGDMNPSFTRVHSKPNGVQWLAYRNEKVHFLNALSDATLANVLYRGYYTGTLRDEDFLLEKYPSLRVCIGNYKDFHRRLVCARACVVDHPITTLHQVLAMNMPTIAYWNPNHWGICADAAPLFDELARVGIVHCSGDDAGCFLEGRYHDIEDWWQSEGVQSVRRRWCHNYARTSKHWAREWLSALWGDSGL